jgi:hypothetical protein
MYFSIQKNTLPSPRVGLQQLAKAAMADGRGNGICAGNPPSD